MAKDDFDVLTFKVLAYLYKKIKTGIADDSYLNPLTDAFPINEEYFYMILEELSEKGYVKDLKLIKAWGGDVVMCDTSKMRITGDGIAYLRDNSRMTKMVHILKEAKDIMSLWS